MRRTVLFTALVILGGVAVTGCEESPKTAKVTPAAVKNMHKPRPWKAWSVMTAEWLKRARSK